MEVEDVERLADALIEAAGDGHRHGSWTSDDRMALRGTLHRISRSCIDGWATTLTLRVGRRFAGAARLLGEDLDRVVAATGGESHSILLVGRPGAGKTTLLRDIALRLGKELGPSVAVVDTSGEIGGFGLKSHPVLGFATFSSRRCRTTHRASSLWTRWGYCSFGNAFSTRQAPKMSASDTVGALPVDQRCSANCRNRLHARVGRSRL